jgi:hypothetical protein
MFTSPESLDMIVTRYHFGDDFILEVDLKWTAPGNEQYNTHGSY